MLSHAPGSPERAALKAALKATKSKEVEVRHDYRRTEGEIRQKALHPSSHELEAHAGALLQGRRRRASATIDAAPESQASLGKMLPWQERAAIFQKQPTCWYLPYRQKNERRLHAGAVPTI